MQKFANNAVGTLAVSITDIETTISVSGSEGNRFPTLTGDDYFYATLVDEDGNHEIVKVTGRVGNTMTVERAQDGTQARAFAAGSVVSHRLTAAVLRSIVYANETKTLQAGYTATPYNAGAKGSGTFKPDPTLSNFQTATNTGAHTLVPPDASCTMLIQYTNLAGAGSINTDQFTKVTGAEITVEPGDNFLFFITKIGAFSHLHVVALQ